MPAKEEKEGMLILYRYHYCSDETQELSYATCSLWKGTILDAVGR
jgi:hypothetical protein